MKLMVRRLCGYGGRVMGLGLVFFMGSSVCEENR